MPKLTKSLIDKLDSIRMQCDDDVELEYDPFKEEWYLKTSTIVNHKNGGRLIEVKHYSLHDCADNFLCAIEQKSTESKTKNL